MLPIRSEPTRPHDVSPREERSRGQYMVEFALSFSIFVIFVLIVIDLGLLIYNHNLFYHGVSKGARAASLGASDTEVTNTVSREVLPSYFPTMLLVAEPEPVTVTPDREMHRVDGKQVTVRMDARFGMSMLWFGNVTVGFPIRSSSVIIQNNDQDRDGCKDSLEGPPGGPAGPPCNGVTGPGTPSPNTFWRGTIRRSHLNGLGMGSDPNASLGDTDWYLFDGPNIDADSTAVNDRNDSFIVANDRLGEDTVAIGFFTPDVSITFSDTEYAIYRPHDSVVCNNTFNLGLLGLLSVTWEECFDGDYQAPELWSGGIEHPAELFPNTLPQPQVTEVTDADHPGYDTRVLHAVYDLDNDGWEDKFDDFPMDPTRH